MFIVIGNKLIFIYCIETLIKTNKKINGDYEIKHSLFKIHIILVSM